MSRPDTGGGGFLERIGRLHALTQRSPSPRVQRLLLAVAAVVFLVGAWAAFAALDVGRDDLRWEPLLVAAFLGVPVTVLASTLEYVVSARILGHGVRFGAALRLTVIATAANLLPLPGAFMVRVQGLRAMGSGYGKAMGSTAIVGLVWIGVSALLAGVLLLPYGRWLASAGFLTVAVPLLFLAYRWLARSVPPGPQRSRIAGVAVVVELLSVLSNAIRLVLILVGLGIGASLGQALVLAVSSSLAAAAGILPGGFGLRELIAAALAPLVGLAASAGFAVTAVNRLIGILVLAPVTAVLALRRQPDERLVETLGRDDQTTATP